MGFWDKIIASFDTSNGGFSARKLSAFAGVSVGVIITFKYIEPQYLIEALIVWLCFALLCLGIITMEQVIKLKNGGISTKENETNN